MDKQILRTFFEANLAILVKLQNLSVMKQKNIHSKSNGKGKYTIHRWLLTKYMHLGRWWSIMFGRYVHLSIYYKSWMHWIKHLPMKYTSSKYIFFLNQKHCRKAELFFALVYLGEICRAGPTLTIFKESID